MAVTPFEGGWALAAAADVALDLGGRKIKVDRVVIVKQTAGTVTLKDGNGAIVLLTGVLADTLGHPFELGITCTSLEYDAVSAGSAIVYVYGKGVRV